MIIFDENVERYWINLIQSLGYPSISIAEKFPGISDRKVVEIVKSYEGLLITEDKDFGELTYRLKLDHKGILLIRLSQLPRIERIELVVQVIENHFNELYNNFSVIDKRGLRIKTAHNRADLR